MKQKPFWKEVFSRLGVMLLISFAFAIVLTAPQYTFDWPNYVTRPIAMLAGMIFGLFYFKRYGVY